MKKILFLFLFILITACNQKNNDKIETNINDINKDNGKSLPLLTPEEIGELSFNNYTNIIAKDPDDYMAYFGRGQTRMYLDDYEGAVDDFTKSIQIDEMFTSAYLYRADSYMKLGMRNKACSDWKRAVILGYSEANDSIKKNCN